MKKLVIMVERLFLQGCRSQEGDQPPHQLHQGQVTFMFTVMGCKNIFPVNSYPGIGRLGSAEETSDYRRFGRQSFNYGDEADFCICNDKKNEKSVKRLTQSSLRPSWSGQVWQEPGF